MTYDTEVSRDQLGQIYKTASSRMTKKALDWDSLKDSFKNLNISDDAKMALLGGLGGAGLGLAAHLITPKDKDEDLRGRMLSQILTGAALGGIAGYGGSRLYKRVGPMVLPEKPGWYQRNAPEVTYSGTATLAGLGAGAYAGAKGLDAVKAKYGLGRLEQLSPEVSNAIHEYVNTDSTRINDLLRSVDRNGQPNLNDRAIGTRLSNVQHALADAHRNTRQRILSSLPHKLQSRLPAWLGGDIVRNASKAQGQLDQNVLTALYELGSNGGTRPIAGSAGDANLIRAMSSRFTNPRKVLTALKRGGKGKNALYAALVSALLLGGGAALRGVNQ